MLMKNKVKARVIKAIVFGILGSLGLFLFYYITLFLVTGDVNHPLVQMKLYQPWMSFLILGFGIQIAIYSLLRSGVHFRLNRQDGSKAQVTAITGTGAVVSGLSMTICCAHHLVELIPILGISGLALFLTEYQKELLIFGVIANFLGLVFMVWILFGREKPRVIFNYFFKKVRL